MEARFIYQNRSDGRFYDASTGEMRGGPDKVNGVLCAMDREAKIAIPVSRWKLMEIGAACFLAALKARGAAPSSLESRARYNGSRHSAPHMQQLHVPVPEPRPAPPEAIDEHLLLSLDDDERAPEASHQEASEAQWERLIREMRDLSRNRRSVTPCERSSWLALF